MENRLPTGLAALLLVLGLGAAVGCATYSDRMRAARLSVEQGDFDGGIKEVNRLLGVRSRDELPERWKKDAALAALERGVLLQAVSQYEDSARDLSAAETELEFLDIKLDTVGDIGKYVYSDSARVYKALPTEKLSLNAVNMLNYLALRNLSGAAVEARRFTVMREYLESVDAEPAHGAFGSYLAGFVFEHMGDYARARRYYENALEDWGIESSGFPGVPSIDEWVHPGSGPPGVTPGPPGDSLEAHLGPTPEILTVIGIGRVPYKVPERIPIGAAVGLGGTFVTGDPRWLGYSALKVVTYPELVPSASRYTGASVEIDGQEVPVRMLTSLGEEIAHEYEAIKPKIIGAALSRMIARAAAAEGTRAAVTEAGGADTVVGMLAALAVEGALVGLDKPDTRSWMFLPARIFVARTAVSRGEHTVAIHLRGHGERLEQLHVDVPAGSFAVVVMTDPR